MKKLLVALALGFAFTQPVLADGHSDLLVMVNSGNAQTQGMAFVLATQAMEQKSGVRVLLCSEGGQLAVKGKEIWFEFRPDRDKTVPRQLTQGLFGVSRTFPAGGGSFSASCTVTPRVESVDVKA